MLITETEKEKRKKGKEGKDITGKGKGKEGGRGVLVFSFDPANWKHGKEGGGERKEKA